MFLSVISSFSLCLVWYRGCAGFTEWIGSYSLLAFPEQFLYSCCHFFPKCFADSLMKPSVPGIFFVGSSLATNWMSLIAIGSFRRFLSECDLAVRVFHEMCPFLSKLSIILEQSVHNVNFVSLLISVESLEMLPLSFRIPVMCFFPLSFSDWSVQRFANFMESPAFGFTDFPLKLCLCSFY